MAENISNEFNAGNTMEAPGVHLMVKPDSELIAFDIAGTTFRALETTLENVANSPQKSQDLLQRFAKTDSVGRQKLADIFIKDPSPVYFFDRDPAMFAEILSYHRSGKLHIPMQLCERRFLEELQFWEVDPSLLASCCLGKLSNATLMDIIPLSPVMAIQGPEDPLHPMTPDMELASLKQITPGGSVTFLGNPPASEPERDMFSGVLMEGFRRKFWDFLEDPSSGRGAKIFSILSIGVVMISVLGLIIGSVPECQDEHKNPHWIIEALELFCIIWFTIEYLVRLALTTKRWEYVKTPLIVIDALSIFPFYLELIFHLAGISTEQLEGIKGALLVTRVLRVLRVARILRLARYSAGMKSCGATLKASYREVGMLVIFVCTMIILFSTTVYFLEKDQKGTKYTSIPTTFWWCIVTITTVGYGDIFPETFGGRLVASLTSISGVIVLAFPITVIVENFYRFYRKEKTESDEARDSPRQVCSVGIV